MLAFRVGALATALFLCDLGRGQAELPIFKWTGSCVQNGIDRASMPFSETSICRSQDPLGCRPLRPNIKILTFPKTVRVLRIKNLRHLMPTASSVANVDVFSKTPDALERAKQILLKV